MNENIEEYDPKSYNDTFLHAFLIGLYVGGMLASLLIVTILEWAR